MVEQLTAEALQANLTKLYWVEGIRWFLLTNAVEVAFYEENGISFSEVALLLSVYNFTNTVAELPSGWLADYIGRKRILVASAAFWAVGFACHVVPTFRMIALGEVLIAVGESLGSGSDEALLFESLRKLVELQHEADPRRAAAGRAAAVEAAVEERSAEILSANDVAHNVSTFAATLAGGVIVALTSRAVFPALWLFCAALYLACGLLYLTMVDPYWLGVEAARAAGEGPVAAGGIRASFSDFWSRLVFTKPCKLLMLDSALSYAGYFLTMKWVVQYHLEAAAAPIWLFGVGYAALKLAAALAARLAPRLQKRGYRMVSAGHRLVVLGLGVGWGLLSIALVAGGTGPVVGAGGVLCCGLALVGMGVCCSVWGALRPLFHTELHMLLEADNRATVLSAENLLANLIIAAVLPLLGAVHDGVGFHTAVLISGPILVGVHSVLRWLALNYDTFEARKKQD